MKLIRVIVFLAVLTGLLATSLPVYAQSTVDGDIGNTFGLFSVTELNSFYANGRYWVFYSDVTGPNHLFYRSSTDSITWSAETTVSSVNNGYSDNEASVWFDGTYGHYARSEGGAIIYRRFLPNADGTLTYSAAKQTAVAAVGGCFPLRPFVSVDTNGYPWIAYFLYTCEDKSYVTKGNTTDGTWSTDASFPYELHSGGSGTQVILPLTSGKTIAIYGVTSTALHSKRWDGSWSSERDTDTAIEDQALWSAVAQDDNVHLVWVADTSYNTLYAEYDYSTHSWSASTVIATGGSATSAPAICRTDLNDLYVFIEDLPDDDKIYYLKYNYYLGEWETVVELVDETVLDGLPTDDYFINCDYNPDSDKVGVYYVSDPQKLKYKDVAETSNVITLTPSAVTASTVTLRGEIISLGTGSVTTRGFQINTVANETDAVDWHEDGSFGLGVYSTPFTGLEPDTIYYYRAYAINSEGTDYGEWVSFITLGDATSVYDPEGNDTMVPVPDEPGGFYQPFGTTRFENTWCGSILHPFFESSGYPLEFVYWFFFILILELVGLAAFGLGRHTFVVFLAGALVISVMGSQFLIDWWLIFVYITTGLPFLVLEARRY